jgi:hypothetical protein
MGEITKNEDAWQRKAMEAAIAAARKIAGEFSAAPAMTPIGKLSDLQWGWIVSAVIFAWVRTRCEQAMAEGFDPEDAMRMTEIEPPPGDVAIARSILPTLAKANFDWTQPLVAWSKDTMVKFLLLAWQLLNSGEVALKEGPAKILRKSDGKREDWDTRGDDIPFDP